MTALKLEEHLRQARGSDWQWLILLYTSFMKMSNIPFGITDWASIEFTEHPGIQGKALWRTQRFADIRVRMVEYTPGYISDHWCEKGHILLCLEGRLETELADGRRFIPRARNKLSSS